MKVFVDIDKTLATDPDGRNMTRYLSRQLGIAAASSLALYDYLECLEVKAWAETNQEHFKQIWKAGQDDTEIQQNAVPARGSRWLLRLLSLVGELSYFTCRLPESGARTQLWLRKHGYPNPQSIYFCENAVEKIQRVATATVGSTHPVVLVDDHAPDLHKAVRHLARTHSPTAARIREHFLLIQFGSFEILNCSPKIVRVAALQEWRFLPLLRAIGRLRSDVVDVEQLLGSLSKKEEILPPRALQQRIAAAQNKQGGPYASLPRSTDNEPL